MQDSAKRVAARWLAANADRLARDPIVKGTGLGASDIRYAGTAIKSSVELLELSLQRGPYRATEAVWHILNRLMDALSGTGKEWDVKNEVAASIRAVRAAADAVGRATQDIAAKTGE